MRSRAGINARLRDRGLCVPSGLRGELRWNACVQNFWYFEDQAGALDIAMSMDVWSRVFNSDLNLPIEETRSGIKGSRRR